MKGKIIITLKSDLCVASGYSYAGVIDSDICYDKYGLPYIPARRLKGCFRDTAENILYGIVDSNEIDKYFGVGGASHRGNIRISNARLKNYNMIVQEISALKQDKELAKTFTKQKVLDQYSHVVAQTAIGENDTAEDKSLRYTRVINHYLSDNNGYKEAVFEANFECDGDDNNFDEKIKLIVGATKNIGLKRNRGMGAVHCELKILDENSKKNNKVAANTINNEEPNTDEEYVITYCLKNDEPLMLSQMSDNHSEKNISGQSMLGHLAGKYLSLNGTSSDSSEFADLFLNGITKYTPAYIAEVSAENETKIYYPAPANINCLKKTKKFVDMFFLPKIEPGNQPKRLKGKYVFSSIDEEKNYLEVKEVDMKLHYHHRKDKLKNDGSIEEGILYPSEAIEPGQVFVGEIYTTGKHVNRIKTLIEGENFYFGKSKSAQYGHCKCEILGIQTMTSSTESNGKAKLLVTLLSDAIIMNEGNYSVNQNAVLKQIAMRIPNASVIEAGNTVMMDTGLISGYQTTWNMHKPLFPVIKAGSCFILDCSDCSAIPNRVWVGTKNQEGYGYAKVELHRERILESIENANANMNLQRLDEFKPQYISILKKGLIDAIITGADDRSKPINVSKTQISRAILMLKQSESFGDFKKRIESIKTDKVRKEFENKLIRTISRAGNVDVGKIAQINPITKKYYELLEKEIGIEVNNIWKDYLLSNLTICKYEAKEN